MAPVNLHRLAEERSLALHRLIAERVRDEPSLLERARDRVRSWLADGSVARPYAEQWAALLEAPPGAVAQALVDPSEAARALRQVSPFAGAVGPRERWQVWRRVRDEFGP
jgi:hypothetical protein